MLKKLLILFCLFMIVSQQKSFAANELYVSINDTYVPFETPALVVEHNKVYAPFQKITRLLGGTALVSENNQLITAYIGNNIFSFNKLTGKATCNDSLLTKDEFQVIDGIAYIAIPYITSANNFKFEKIIGLPFYRINLAEPTLSKDDYTKKMQTDIARSKKPTIYLTFDDGPNSYTAQNLKTLQQYNVTATFFFVGRNITNQHDLVKKTLAAGNTIGLHSMSHNVKMVYASTQSYIQEMLDEQALISTITGKAPILVRSPYGSVPYMTNAMAEALIAHHFILWDWDVDPTDWKLNDATYKQIVANVQTGILQAEKRKDQHIVVLLHDRSGTAKALPYILSWLQKEGYPIETYNPNTHFVQNFLKNTQL